MASLDRIKRHLGRVYGRTSSTLLDAAVDSTAHQFDSLGRDIDSGVAQLLAGSASADWLDFWGTVFGVGRNANPTELDEPYAARIIEEIVRQRSQGDALVDIVLKTLGITIIIRDLWPLVLGLNQFTVPAGRPPQSINGHLTAGWIDGTVDDVAVRLGFAPPYEEGAFGVWLAIDPGDPFEYTLQNVIDLLPHVLQTNDLVVGAEHELNGHITSPDLGGLGDTAKYLFGVEPDVPHASIAEVLAVIERHRASGTEAVFMGFVLPT